MLLWCINVLVWTVENSIRISDDPLAAEWRTRHLHSCLHTAAFKTQQCDCETWRNANGCQWVTCGYGEHPTCTFISPLCWLQSRRVHTSVANVWPITHLLILKAHVCHVAYLFNPNAVNFGYNECLLPPYRTGCAYYSVNAVTRTQRMRFLSGIDRVQVKQSWSSSVEIGCIE